MMRCFSWFLFLWFLSSSAGLAQESLPAASREFGGLLYEIRADQPLAAREGMVTFSWAERTETGRRLTSASVKSGKSLTVGELIRGLAAAFEKAGDRGDGGVLYEVGHLDHGGLLRVVDGAAEGEVQFFYLRPGQDPEIILFEPQAAEVFRTLLFDLVQP